MPDTPEASIGWGRAILTTAVIAIVGIAILVYVPNAALTKMHGVGRSARVAIAPGAFASGLVVLAWALRRLQRRGAI